MDTIKKNHAAGQKKQYGPRLVGEVIIELLNNSNEPLAVAYRNRFHPDTHLDVDLKLLTRQPGRMNIGDCLVGIITRYDEDHFRFIESDTEKKRGVVEQRNPHVYVGTCVNVKRKDDGTLYPTFNRPHYTKDFTFQDFCRQAAEELLAVAGLVEEG